MTYIRKCRKCGLEALNKTELEHFVFRRLSKYSRDNLCIECKNSYQRERWKNPRDPKKASQLSKRYDCSPQEYIERMESSTVCEICHSDHDLVYDHCHETMRFRGVLCRSCNRSIGQLGDTLESLQKAVDYLKKC